MNWLIYAIGSAISFAALNLLSRVLSVGSKDQRVMAVVFNFYAMILATAIFFLTGTNWNFSLPDESIAYVFLLIACLFYGLWERLRFFAAGAVEASVMAIVNNLSLVVAFMISLFLYSEPIDGSKITGFSLIVLSLVLISWGKISRINLKGIAIAITANVILGVGWSLDKKGMQYFNPETYSFLAWLIPLIVIIFPSVSIEKTKKVAKAGSWKLLLLAAINVGGYLINLKAQQIAEATKVIPIVQTSTVITVILAAILLKEREHLARNIVAGIVAVAGVFLLV